jgi:hypothetical protein
MGHGMVPEHIVTDIQEMPSFVPGNICFYTIEIFISDVPEFFIDIGVHGCYLITVRLDKAFKAGYAHRRNLGVPEGHGDQENVIFHGITSY